MELKVSFLYCVSHGDCAVVTFEEGGKKKCIVVDGGENKESAKALSAHLTSEGIQKIDLMVGTHIDSDHIQGLNKFVEEELRKKDAGKPWVSISEFWGPAPSEDQTPDTTGKAQPQAEMPGGAMDWQRYVIESVAQNDELFARVREAGARISHPAFDDQPANPFRSVTIEVLGPDTQIPADEIKTKALGLTTRASDGGIDIRGLDDLELAVSQNFQLMAMEADRTANNQSIVFRLTPAAGGSRGGKAWSFLFTGDAEKEAWETMLGNAETADALAARVLKTPHHGSRNGITEAAAQQVKAEYGIISVGSKHGLPDAEALSAVRAEGGKILCTHRNNDSKKKSACYSIPGDECPAKGAPETITFRVCTDSGDCDITPSRRECKHCW
jgi:beta-lactamase superfamily II metal-dependent hydrolase